jgi:hypothetical protein
VQQVPVAERPGASGGGGDVGVAVDGEALVGGQVGDDRSGRVLLLAVLVDDDGPVVVEEGVGDPLVGRARPGGGRRAVQLGLVARLADREGPLAVGGDRVLDGAFDRLPVQERGRGVREHQRVVRGVRGLAGLRGGAGRR